jgi:hypothetical protein
VTRLAPGLTRRSVDGLVNGIAGLDKTALNRFTETVQ